MRPNRKIRKSKPAAVMLLAVAGLFPTLHAHNEHALGREAIAWSSSDPTILRVIATNFDFHGGDNFITYRPHGRVERRGDHDCLVGPYFFFDVDDRFAFDIDETITLEILFDGSASSGFNFSYDQAIKPTAQSHRFDTASGERWQRVTLELERARFANRKYEKTDFAIGAPNSKFPPGDYESGHTVAVCDIRVNRGAARNAIPKAGHLRLRVIDEHGEPTVARAGIYTAEGYAPLASPDALTILRFGERLRDLPLRIAPPAWHDAGRFVFYVDGAYRSELEAGDYTVVLSKGPEYRVASRSFSLVPGQTHELEITLERWSDMPARGWYSGDDHVHLARPDPSINPTLSAYLRAEDVHVANLLQMANVTTSHFPQYAFGDRGQYLSGNHALVPGQESPRTSHRGHTIGLNAKHFHWPGEDYFLYDQTALAIHEDGGLWGYAHVALDAFNVAWGLALDVPLGYVDFFEMLQMNTLNTNYFYDFLNMGFRILPSAGSDYPYIHVAGSERVYVQLNEPFSVPAWFKAWQTNRAFVSNAPIISFTVNEDTAASAYDVDAGEAIDISAVASVNPDYDSLERLELVVHGNVVASSKSPETDGSLKLDHSFTANTPLWFALRAYGKGDAKAHTGAVFISVDGEQDFHDRETVGALAAKYRDLLQSLKQSRPNLNEEWERFNVENDVLRKWDEDKPALDKRIQRAITIYEHLIEQAGGAGRL